MALYQAFEFQVGRLPVQKHNFHVDVFSVFVQEVLEKVTDTFVSYVSANDNVSVERAKKSNFYHIRVRSAGAEVVQTWINFDEARKKMFAASIVV